MTQEFRFCLLINLAC